MLVGSCGGFLFAFVCVFLAGRGWILVSVYFLSRVHGVG